MPGTDVCPGNVSINCTEQHGAEIVAQRIKKAVESSTVRVGTRGREVKVTIAYSSLTLASKAPDGNMTVSGPLDDEQMVSSIETSNQD